MNDKIKKMSEALRKPQAKDDKPAYSVTYGRSTNTEEEIGRRIKVNILPKMTELCKELEYAYNDHTYEQFDDKKSAKSREELLKPMEETYRSMKECEGKIINYLKSLSEKANDNNK